MNKTDRDFVLRVYQWRNEDHKIQDLVKELQDSIDEQSEEMDNQTECDSLWDIGYDEGFYVCSNLILAKLKEVLK